MAQVGLKRQFCFWWLILAFAVSVGACSSKGTGRSVSVASPDFFGIAEELAVQLAASLRQPFGDGGRLILASMVNIDDLYQTSRFGRTLTEALATRLFRHGFGVVEVRKAKELLVKSRGGELMLTRDAKLLAHKNNATAIVTGTYALTPDSVIINVRFLDAGGRDVLSVAGLELQRSRAINALLTGTAAQDRSYELSAYER